MGNSIDTISGFHYSPYRGVQRANPTQLPDNTRQTLKAKNKTPESEECKTCSSRTYKDQSNDSSVSFQTPTRISPEMAATAVRAHEKEHVSHNAETAEKQGMTAHSTVAINTDVCPECSRIYVSGGTTTTTYSPKNSPRETGPEQTKGKQIDIVA